MSGKGLLCSLILAAMCSVAAQGLVLTHFQCSLDQTHSCFADGHALALRVPQGLAVDSTGMELC